MPVLLSALPKVSTRELPADTGSKCKQQLFIATVAQGCVHTCCLCKPNMPCGSSSSIAAELLCSAVVNAIGVCGICMLTTHNGCLYLQCPVPARRNLPRALRCTRDTWFAKACCHGCARHARQAIKAPRTWRRHCAEVVHAVAHGCCGEPAVDAGVEAAHSSGAVPPKHVSLALKGPNNTEDSNNVPVSMPPMCA